MVRMVRSSKCGNHGNNNGIETYAHHPGKPIFIWHHLLNLSLYSLYEVLLLINTYIERLFFYYSAYFVYRSTAMTAYVGAGVGISVFHDRVFFETPDLSFPIRRDVTLLGSDFKTMKTGVTSCFY